jgi:hypothetical protein
MDGILLVTKSKSNIMSDISDATSLPISAVVKDEKEEMESRGKKW